MRILLLVDWRSRRRHFFSVLRSDIAVLGAGGVWGAEWVATAWRGSKLEIGLLLK